MTIGEIATVRTGLVAARKKKSLISNQSYQYKLLNLKCISNDGHIEQNELEQYEISEKLKDDYLTQSGDILIRLRYSVYLWFNKTERNCADSNTVAFCRYSSQ